MKETYSLSSVAKQKDLVAYYDANNNKIICKILSINEDTKQIKIIPEETTSLLYVPTENIDIVTNKNYELTNEGRDNFYDFLIKERTDFIELKNSLTDKNELFSIFNKNLAKSYRLGASNDEVLTTIKLYGDIDYWIASKHGHMSNCFILQITDTAFKLNRDINSACGFRPAITLLPKIYTYGKDENNCWTLVPQYYDFTLKANLSQTKSKIFN